MLLIIANPTGSFPLNDDWNYIRSAQLLAEQGRMLITCWNCSTNLVQIFYGAILVKLFGFSFEILRASTWLAGLGACVATYLLVKESSRRPVLAFVAALTLMSNAIFFNLSNTFMTDIPFLAVLIGSMYYAVRALRYGQNRDYLSALGLGLVSTFLRQYGVVFLGLFVITYAIGRLKERNLLINSFGILLFAGALLLAFRAWLTSYGLPGCYTVWMVYIQKQLSGGVGPLFGTMLFNYLTEVIYLGLFVLPFAFGCIPFVFGELIKKERIFAFVCAAELMICLLIGLVVKGVMMPLTTNVLHSAGVGPVLFAELKSVANEKTLGFFFWLLVTLMSCKGVSIAFALTVSRALSLKRTGGLVSCLNDVIRFREAKIAFLFSSFICIYLSILAFTGLIDRYILPALPALFVVLGMLGSSRPITAQTADLRNPAQSALRSPDIPEPSIGVEDLASVTTFDDGIATPQRSFQMNAFTSQEGLPEAGVGGQPDKAMANSTITKLDTQNSPRPFAKPIFLSAALVCVFIFASFSVAATHDYFAVSRARWEALNYALRDLKIDPMLMEGGWEFNGWIAYAPSAPPPKAPENLSMRHGDEYAVSDRLADGYTALRSWNVERWLSSTAAQVNLLRRNE